MASTYSTLYSFRSVQVSAGNIVTDVERVTIQSIPHGLVATVPVPIDLWTQGPPYWALDLMAGELETLADQHHVVAASPGQDVDLNNLTVDFIALTVALDRSAQGLPPLYGTVNVPLTDFITDPAAVGQPPAPGTTPPYELADAEYARLEALA